MITKDLLRQVIYEQRELRGDLGVERHVSDLDVLSPEILVISGVRRCGKSVLVRQIQNRQKEQDYYVSFDDERLLHFSVEDFQLLNDTLAEDFGVQHTFYLDEVQLIPGWERYVNRLFSHHNKVFVTGSNAYLLSRELGTFLTGRHLTKELFPMSLSEYATLKHLDWTKSDFYTTEGRARLVNMQSSYLKEGGFPQYLLSGNAQYLQELYNDILYRDIVVRYKLSTDRQIREMVYYLASNYTHRFTYNSVAKAVGIKSAETVSDYIGYLKDAYLVGVLTKYDYKVGEQLKSPKKVYFIDNGLVGQIGFGFSTNWGSQLENAVYLELCRRGNEIFYYSGKSECDFVVRTGGKISAAYQVAMSIREESTRQREIAGAKEAMDVFGLDTSYIITLDESEELSIDEGNKIYVLPFYKWVLF